MIRITPDDIKMPKRNDIILIGTNESGIHGGGIAKYAYDNWDLEWGKGYGPSGSCFGLPTKDWEIQTLPLFVIEVYVNRYIAWTQMERQKRKRHYVTQIGCGLAGYQPWQIAPLFKSCIDMGNIWLPEKFINVIEPKLLTSYDGADLNRDEGY